MSFFIYYIFTLYVSYVFGGLEIVIALHKKETEFFGYYCLGSLVFTVCYLLIINQFYLSAMIFIPMLTSMKFVELSEIEMSKRIKYTFIFFEGLILLGIWLVSFIYIFDIADFNKFIKNIQEWISIVKAKK